MEYKVEVFTGIRPTQNFTVANYIGAVKKVVKLQEDGKTPMVFVADLHSLTDQEPEVAMKFTRETVTDYLALGVDPEKATIFVQSDIAPQLGELTLYLLRHVTVAELLRVPALKDKLKKNQRGETANALLAAYPVLMASDILIQRSEYVPVGKDQDSHLEVTRTLAKRFNKRYGDILPVIKSLEVESFNVLSLRGEGKMSKTKPEGAIFLTDSKEDIAKKIKRAETAFAGEMPEILESHVKLAKGLASDSAKQKEVDEIIEKHMAGENVMGDFKGLLTEITQEFVAQYQKNRGDISDSDIDKVLETGKKRATEGANETMDSVRKAMQGKI